MLELKGTVPEAASECLSSISEAPQMGGGGVTNKCSSKNKNKNKKQVAMKRPKRLSKFAPLCDHTIVRKMKGPRVDVDAICAAMLEGYEKNRVLWEKKQELKAAATDMGPSTDETSRKNETTKRKRKKNKNKRSKMKIPFNF